MSRPWIHKHFEEDQSAQYASGGRCHFRSVVMDAGSRGTTAHAHHPMLYISELCEDCTVANELTMREPANHDNGQGVTASDVILQQRIL